jgi:hypothetical protein
LVLECWVWFSSFPAGTYVDFVGKGFYQWNLEKIWISDRVRFRVYDGSVQQQAQSDAEISLNTWYYVVGRYNAGTQEVALFMNGVKQAAVGSSATIASDPFGFCMGRNSRQGDFYFTGYMDEVRVHQAERSDSWILTSYRSQNNPAAFYALVGGEVAMPALTATPTTTPRATMTSTPTPLATRTPTPSATASWTATPSATPYPSPAASATSTPTRSASLSHTPTVTRTASPTPQPVNWTPTSQPSARSTATPTPLLMATFTITAVPGASGKVAARVSPNPFAPGRNEKARFYAGNAPVRQVRIFNMKGHLVRSLTEAQTWDGHDNNGSACEGGVYLFQIEADGERLTGTLVLVQ